MGLDAHTQDRLRALREHDTLGFYRGDAPARAQDATSAVEVTIDPTDRVTAVRLIAEVPVIRRPQGLRDAVEEAFRAARRARLNALGVFDQESTARGRPRAEAPSRSIRTVENWMGTGWQPDPSSLRPHRFDTSDFGPTAGVSANNCVTVSLDIASSHGTVDAEPGWLSQATRTNIGRAITEAFHDAYRKRDAR